METWNEWRLEQPNFYPDLRGAYFSDANLVAANLIDANLIGADRTGADFTNVILGYTTFAENDLSEVKGLETVRSERLMVEEGEPLTTDLPLKAEVRLYYDVWAPRSEPAPLLLALHGYGSNKGWMMREARRHVPEGFAVAALQGPHQHMKEPHEKGGPLRYGFGWLTNFRPEESVALHHGAVLDLVEALVARGVALRESVFLMGFSQSCALNYRFAFTHPGRLRGVIGICGGMPGDWETNPVYGETRAAVLHLSGTRDEFYTPERVAPYAEQLRRRARDVETRAYDAAHEFVPEMRADVRAWLAARA